jgi:hypothetical protein
MEGVLAEWIDLVRNMDQWRDLLKKMTNLQLTENTGIFFSG